MIVIDIMTSNIMTPNIMTSNITTYRYNLIGCCNYAYNIYNKDSIELRIQFYGVPEFYTIVYNECINDFKEILYKCTNKKIYVILTSSRISRLIYNTTNIFFDIIKILKNMNIMKIKLYNIISPYCSCDYSSINKLMVSPLYGNTCLLKKQKKLFENINYKQKEINTIYEKIFKENKNKLYGIYNSNKFGVYDLKQHYEYREYWDPLSYFNDDNFVLPSGTIYYEMRNNELQITTIDNLNIDSICCLSINLSANRNITNTNQQILLNIKHCKSKIILLRNIIKNNISLKKIILSNKILKNKTISKITCLDCYSITNYTYVYVPELLFPLINQFAYSENNIAYNSYASKIKILNKPLQNIRSILKYYKYINNRKNYEKYNKNNLIKLLFILRYFDISTELTFIMLKYY